MTPLVPEPDILVRAVREAIDAVISLGGAEIGDKTMVDAAIPSGAVSFAKIVAVLGAHVSAASVPRTELKES